ncbi:type II toxin-antitoxin system RelE/ParE family toxin [Spirosoma fluviale]|uniref:Addiction module toxin, RelE/StbE family n=1 Tax=Spirosoma fluviale TaxID=1597977 RepID=A0A286GA77_9BACT|nr:addiction module toxin, RelE/StbE family [Spirosoma fluviale]
MIRINFTNRAIEDLDAINEYRSTYSPAYADHLIDTLIAKVEQLKTFPEMGRKVPEFDLSYLRELIHSEYRIVCKIVNDGQIDVITIQHSSRNMSERFFDS